MNEQFKDKFRIKELMVREYDFWILSLRPQQPTPGSLVLSLKRDCRQLGYLTGSETSELAKIFYQAEATIHRLFDNDKINYLALMMVDDHVHFHIIPRYASARVFNGIEFTDKNWPKPPDVTANTCDAPTLSKLLVQIKTKLNETYA